MDTSEHQPTVDLAVEGMTCAGCAGRIARALEGVPGVTNASVNLASHRARVAGTAPLASLVTAVEGAGYRAAAAPSDKAGQVAADAAEKKRSRREFWRLAYAIAFTLPLVMEMAADLFGHHLIPGWKQALLATPVQFWAGAPFYGAAWRALRARSGNMDLLVTLGTLAAYGFSLYQLAAGAPHLYFEVSAVVVTLVLLGRRLEARARRSASASLRA